jgi:hypothetical protein
MACGLFEEKLQLPLQGTVVTHRPTLQALDGDFWNIADVKRFHSGSILHPSWMGKLEKVGPNPCALTRHSMGVIALYDRVFHSG